MDLELQDATSEAVAFQCEAAVPFVLAQRRQILKYCAYLAMDVAGIFIVGYVAYNYGNLVASKVLLSTFAIPGIVLAVGSALNMQRCYRSIANVRSNLERIANQ